MKRCPTCNCAYEDSMSFCLDDGTPLLSASSNDPGATATTPAPRITNQAPTEILGAETVPYARPASPGAEKYYAPPQYAPPVRRQSALPWILGAALILGISAIVVALIFNRNRSDNSQVAQKTESAPQPVNTNVNLNVNRPASNANANVNNAGSANPDRNANGNESHGNTNINSTSNAPTNQNEVLQDLKALEDKWNQAQIKGDKAALNYVLADDYRDKDGDKKKYIAVLKPIPDIVSVTPSELNLTLSGNDATIKGINTFRFKNGSLLRYRFTDTFVWRDGRWQATGSVSNRIK